ncbi:expressed unknown protein [Seminavis robusta]|uniref:Uncharacterized protein n=1 Tax=Seminavis robusta TaxID=568900 RepID=A0A9N8DRM0_9STRA|nr:expressed unknown protein [Seminavis robusta]|eukprot:Sro290_g109400.1 n/a (109) ;mRNA; r:63399-63725
MQSDRKKIQAKKRAVSQAYSFAKTLKDFGRMDEANQKLDEAMILEATPLEHFLMNCAPTTVTAAGTATVASGLTSNRASPVPAGAGITHPPDVSGIQSPNNINDEAGV